MNKIVPFVQNSSDNMHCVPAVFRMINQYYFGKDLTWEEIDKVMKVIPERGVWTFPGLTYFANKGLQIINIEPLDYNLLFQKGENYLKEIFGEKTSNYYINKSNISSVIPFIPEFLKIVKHENRKATINDVVEYLSKGFLIGVEVNSAILNNKEGLNLHYVLLYGFDGENILLNDPGLPAIQGRIITLEEFEKAFNYEGANTAITAFNKP